MTTYAVSVRASDGSWSVSWQLEPPFIAAKANFIPSRRAVARLVTVGRDAGDAVTILPGLFASGFAGGHALRMDLLEAIGLAAEARDGFGAAASLFVSLLHSADLAGDDYWSNEGRRLWLTHGSRPGGSRSGPFGDFGTGDFWDLPDDFMSDLGPGKSSPFGAGVAGLSDNALDGLFGRGLKGYGPAGPGGGIAAIFGGTHGLDALFRPDGKPTPGELRDQLDPTGRAGISDASKHIIKGVGVIAGGAFGAHVGGSLGAVVGPAGAVSGLLSGGSFGAKMGEAASDIVIGVLSQGEAKDTKEHSEKPSAPVREADTSWRTSKDADGTSVLEVTNSKSDGSSLVEVDKDTRVVNSSGNDVQVKRTDEKGNESSTTVPPHGVDLGYIVDSDVAGNGGQFGPYSFGQPPGRSPYALTADGDERTGGPVPGGPIFYIGRSDGPDQDNRPADGKPGFILFTSHDAFLNPIVTLINKKPEIATLRLNFG